MGWGSEYKTTCSLQSVYKLSWCIGLHFVCCVMLLWCANFNDVSTVQLEPLPGQSINVHYQLLLWRKKKVSLYNTTPQLYRNFLPQKFRGWTLSFNIFPSMMVAASPSPSRLRKYPKCIYTRAVKGLNTKPGGDGGQL